ncbi:MAG: taurine catabolism dioxygenase TauD [Rhodospirillaceae bacterium]|nr:taurine catabolism dioxygenase TauD [Rhodospirillaceae bacterium]|tara:strand:- start:748 stop:1605 length:858 start_codon:yes stop_codon:yes gene_type:complete
MSNISVTPLSNACGAEISGVDLKNPLKSSVSAEINQAWLEHCVIVIRDQDLSDIDQVNFAEAFGQVGDYLRPDTLRNDAMKDRHRSVMFVSNIVENGEAIGTLPDGEMMFHTDTGYAQNPHKATTLFAIEIPSKGGNTIFSNQYKVYENLPKRLKKLLSGRNAQHAYEFGVMVKDKEFYNGPDVRTATHPVFRVHSETGRRTIYVNELMTESIEGLSAEESREVLKEIFALQKEKQFCYEHVWRKGDLIMWDNRCTLHARTDFPKKQRRLLRRVTIEDSTPNTAA